MSGGTRHYRSFKEGLTSYAVVRLAQYAAQRRAASHGGVEPRRRQKRKKSGIGRKLTPLWYGLLAFVSTWFIGAVTDLAGAAALIILAVLVVVLVDLARWSRVNVSRPGYERGQSVQWPPRPQYPRDVRWWPVATIRSAGRRLAHELSALQVWTAKLWSTLRSAVAGWSSGRARNAWSRRLMAAYALAWAAWVGHGLVTNVLYGGSELAWLALVCAGLVVHWTGRKRDGSSTLDRALTKWDDRNDAAGLAGSYFVRPKKTVYGWEAVLQLDPGRQTYDDAVKRKTQIESALGLAKDSLYFEHVKTRRADQVLVRAMTTDPHAKPIDWTAPTLKRVQDPINVGPYIDGQPCLVRLFEAGIGTFRVLLAGVPGSGKSTLMHQIALEYAPLQEVELWLVDLKGGQEFGIYRNLAQRYAEGPEQAMQLVNELEQLTNERGGSRLVTPSVDQPLIILMIDEFAELTANVKGAPAKVASIARRVRSKGIAMVIATHRPTKEALGSVQIRDACNTRFCFRTADAQQAGFVLAHLKVSPEAIDTSRRGTCYVEKEEGVTRSIPVRCNRVEDDPIFRQIEQLTGQLVPDPEVKATVDHTTDDSDTAVLTQLSDQVTADEATSVTEPMIDVSDLPSVAETSDQTKTGKKVQEFIEWVRTERADDPVFSRKELTKACGFSPATGTRKLLDLRRDGVIEQIGDGRYRLTT